MAAVAGTTAAVAAHTNPVTAVIFWDEGYQIAWQHLGSLLIRSAATLEEGIASLQRAIELDPYDGWSYAYLANALWRAGRLDKAEAAFNQATDSDPSNDQFKVFLPQFKSRARRKDAQNRLTGI